MDTGVRFTVTAQTFAPAVTVTKQSITPAMSVAMPIEVPEYDGPYEVTPRVQGQTLHTKNRRMTEDVTVRDIPVYRVSNPAGGSTVYIAKEVDDG